MRRASRPVGLAASLVLALVLGGLAVAVPRADAGACAAPPPLALALVRPGADVPLDGEAGPLLEEVAGPRDPARSRGRAPSLFASLRVDGPRGAVSVLPQALAPGLHRLRGAFAPGEHRVRGIQGGGTVRFAPPADAPLPAPVLARARRHTGERSGPRGAIGASGGPRWRPSPYVHVTLRAAPPPGAWMALLYVGAEEHGGAAVHAVPVEAGATQLTFTQTRPARCGPPLPVRGVPNAGDAFRLKWLTRTGRLSPSSAPVTAVAAP